MNIKTELFLKRQASNVRFYSPVVGKGTLLVAAAAFGAILHTLHQWKAQTEVSALDVKIMWAFVGYESVLAAIGYVDNSVAIHKERQKRRDETEAFGRASQTDQSGKLKQLG